MGRTDPGKPVNKERVLMYHKAQNYPCNVGLCWLSKGIMSNQYKENFKGPILLPQKKVDSYQYHTTHLLVLKKPSRFLS